MTDSDSAVESICFCEYQQRTQDDDFSSVEVSSNHSKRDRECNGRRVQSFIPPLPPPPAAIWPYGPPMYYNDPWSFMYRHHQDSLGHMPVAPPFAPMLHPAVPDLQLPFKILKQIDYYFSDDNLAKDVYLRQQMDLDGWVPIDLIADFKKIKALTNNVPLILDALRASNVVEIQGQKKVRRKDNYKKWILPDHFLTSNLWPEVRPYCIL